MYDNSVLRFTNFNKNLKKKEFWFVTSILTRIYSSCSKSVVYLRGCLSVLYHLVVLLSVFPIYSLFAPFATPFFSYRVHMLLIVLVFDDMISFLKAYSGHLILTTIATVLDHVYYISCQFTRNFNSLLYFLISIPS